jgi:hypothetical protein
MITIILLKYFNKKLTEDYYMKKYEQMIINYEEVLYSLVLVVFLMYHLRAIACKSHGLWEVTHLRTT